MSILVFIFNTYKYQKSKCKYNNIPTFIIEKKTMQI